MGKKAAPGKWAVLNGDYRYIVTVRPAMSDMNKSCTLYYAWTQISKTVVPYYIEIQSYIRYVESYKN